jgi:hypothetical protein
MGNTVHIAFGFHVNCYHSYRGDTNDKAGFGNDIKIMRKTLGILDQYNASGVGVKGTWDCENVYSLEKILPQYAPDIIERWKKRVEKNGDEQILMSYNNGALPALTGDEFDASIKWAVTNEAKSGLKDLFGKCAMVIRPQEVMFSPSDVSRYEKLGVKAVCLYYSTNPFDAFRTLVKPLEDEKAYNPLTYRYQNHSVEIIPTYSQLDLMDTGSLRYLAYKLHDEQEKGQIKRDVLIFINMDADSLLWDKFPVPAFLQKKPNFGGLGGLIGEVCDLPWVVFDTPGNYASEHQPAGEVFFGEDTADGNFTGYASWAEKPFNRLIWTRAEKARAYSRLSSADFASPSFQDRVKLLSTTHFGLATPVLNITREQKALALSKEAIAKETAVLTENSELTIKKTNKSLFSSVFLSLKEGTFKKTDGIKLSGENLSDWAAGPLSFYPSGDIKEAFLLIRFQKLCDSYQLKIEPSEIKPEASSGMKQVSFNPQTGSFSIKLSDKQTLDFNSKITYGKKARCFSAPREGSFQLSGSGNGQTFQGAIHLPKEKSAGRYSFVFISVPFSPGLIVISDVVYPYTPERDQISSAASDLGRFTDNKWNEVIPSELSLPVSGECQVTKRNFRGEYSSFPLKDLYSVCPENRNLASFNQALTGGVMKIQERDRGFYIGHARQFNGSLAHCPMRLKEENSLLRLSLNPFGTYYGPQRAFPSVGNGSVLDIYAFMAPQSQSLAPSYDGAEEKSFQFLAPLNAEVKDLESFADGDLVLPSPEAGPDTEDQVSFLTPKQKGTVKARRKSSPLKGKVFKLLGVLIRFIHNSRHFRRLLKRLEKEYKARPE